jgi:anthranilate phosphoribosyltransferase
MTAASPVAEHPFAHYIRILGKGPTLSRSLTRDESLAAARMVMAGQVDRLQLGALLSLMRMMTETPEEVAGFVLAARETLALPADSPAVQVDWPSYAGKKTRLPWFLLSALAMAQGGVRVFMHGVDDHTPGRLYSGAVLAALGVPPAQSLVHAAQQLRDHDFAYLPLDRLCPKLHEIMALKPLLGLRSPAHTIIRALNPFAAPCQMIGVAHPPYRTLHQDAARLLEQPALAVFKGDGGEAERRPEKPCLVGLTINGTLSEENWPPLLEQPSLPRDPEMDPARLAAVWNGALRDSVAEATVIGTAAVALKTIGRATTQEDAECQARALWLGRRPLTAQGAA